MEEIFKELELTDTVKETLSERINALKSDWQEAAKNDPEFHNEMKKKATGKVWDMAESRIKKYFGLTADDIKSLEHKDEFGSRFDAILKHGAGRLKTEQSQTVEEWQNKYLEAKNKVNEYEETIIPGIKTEAEKEKDNMFIQYHSKNHASTLDLIVNPEHIYPTLEKTLGSYVFKIQDGQILPYNGDGESRVTIKDKIVSFNGLVEDILEPFTKKSNGKGNGGAEKPPPGGHEYSDNAKIMAQRMGIPV